MLLNDPVCPPPDFLVQSGVARAAPPAIPARRTGTRTASCLTALEQSVVALSLFDHRSSIAPLGVVMRAITVLFGRAAATPLADPRLEALRRYSVLLRDGRGTMPAEEIQRMHDIGFSAAALREIGHLVAAGQLRR